MADELIPTHLTLRLLRLPTHRTLAAAHDQAPDDHRLLTVVAAHLDGDMTSTKGWGECSALNHAGYTNESAEGAYQLLAAGAPFDAQINPLAAAAIQMAVLDVSLRHAGQSLSERLGTAGLSAPAGCVVGMAPIPHMLSEIEALVEQGYRRLKCKIAPGRVVEPIRAVHTAFPDLELHVDANGTLSTGDFDQIRSLGDLGVRAVEQPFAVGDHAPASQLVAQSEFEVIADEAVLGVDSLWELARDRAATAVVVKPPKLGGLEAALGLLEAAHEAGMHAAIGGMLEGGLGRHQLASLAPLSNFDIIGDLSPAGQWLAADPFADIELIDGRVPAPSPTGIAGDPNAEALDRYTVSSATVSFQGPSPT